MALRLGHKQSEDFDLFSNETFEPASLLTGLDYLRSAKVEQRGNNTLTVFVDRGGQSKFPSLATFGWCTSRIPT